MLTKQECQAMRGLAIIGIMLHNYCHWLAGITQENEYIWQQANNERLMQALSQPDTMLPIHLFSYFGHYGVPVFLLLSGFGLVMKHEHGNTMVSPWRFLCYNYLKLLRIMIVGFVGFAMVDAATRGAHRYEAVDIVAMLTMTSNFLENPSEVIWPGPYWYFGLTLQLYMVYRLVFYRWRHWGVVAGAVALCWLLQVMCQGDDTLLKWLRYNCIGGMMPFAMGVLAGRYLKEFTLRPAQWTVVLVVSCALGAVSCLTFQTWLWTPAAVAVAAIAVAKLLPKAALKYCVWFGGLSAAIFVCHPMVRKLFVFSYGKHEVYAGLLLYVVCTVGVAWLFQKIISRIPKPQP